MAKLMKTLKDNKWLVVILLIGVVLGGYFIYTNYFKQVGVFEPDQKSDPLTGITTDAGDCSPSGRSGIELSTCCYDSKFRAIDCKTNAVLSELAIYGSSQAVATPGKFYVKHGLRVTNTGSANLAKVYITGVTITPVSPTPLANQVAAQSALVTGTTSCTGDATKSCKGYSAIIGSALYKPVTVGQYVDFSTEYIELKNVPSGLYEVAITFVGESNDPVNLPTITSVYKHQIYVQQESLGFSISVTI